MKRPFVLRRTARIGDIRADMSEKQLAAIGAVSLAYNEVERDIDLLFFSTTRLNANLQMEVSSRVNGIDGKIEIIKKGAATFPVNQTVLTWLAESLGDGAFKKLKSYRDAVVHARLLSSPASLGVVVGKRGKMSQVWLGEAALSSLYDHLAGLERELAAAVTLFTGILHYEALAADDPRRSSFEKEKAAWIARYHARRDSRLALQPIPQFPSEAELNEADARWLQAVQDALMAYSPRYRDNK